MKARRLSSWSVTALWLACALRSYPLGAHAQITTTVQFDREIVRILDDHCVMCHAPDGPAFALMTYEQTYAARWQIRMDALNGHMPPWAAAPGIGDFANSNALTQRETDFLVSWAESFGPRNNGQVALGVAADPSLAPPVQAHLDLARWALGQPDLQLPLPAGVPIATSATSGVRAVIDPKITAMRGLRGLEFKPHNRRLVRWASFTDQAGNWLGTWTPWYGFMSVPAPLIYALAPGSKIIVDIHYVAGAPELQSKSGTLGLYYADPGPQSVASMSLRAGSGSEVDATRRKLQIAVTLQQDENLLALQPGAVAGLKSLQVSARLPDGAVRVLLFAPDVSATWPTSYVLRSAVHLPKGTQLTAVGYVDSAASWPQSTDLVTLSLFAGAALAPRPPGPSQVVHVQRFRLEGTVRAVDVAAGKLLVEHGDIPGFMSAMTMSYSVGPHEKLDSITAGDQIRSDVVVSDGSNDLENIRVTRHAK